MNVLDKILEEIEKAEENYKKRCPVLLKGASSMAADVKEIIRSHMDKVENDGWISVEERLPETDDYILISFDNVRLSILEDMKRTKMAAERFIQETKTKAIAA